LTHFRHFSNGWHRISRIFADGESEVLRQYPSFCPKILTATAEETWMGRYIPLIMVNVGQIATDFFHTFGNNVLQRVFNDPCG